MHTDVMMCSLKLCKRSFHFKLQCKVCIKCIWVGCLNELVCGFLCWIITDDDRESGIHVSDGETMDTDSRPCGPTSPGQSGLPQYWHKRLRSFSVGELHTTEQT